MTNIEGLYSALNAIIRTKEDEDRLAVDIQTLIDEVKDEVDIYSASLDWYVQNVLRAAAEVALWQNGYRAVVKGKWLFVNPEHCNNPAYVKRLFNNAKLAELQKKQVVDFLQKKVTQMGMNGQLSFDMSNYTIIENVTTAQLIEMLIKDANGADGE